MEMADDGETHELTLDQARSGITLQTGKRHRIVIRRPQLVVRLLIDPSTPPSKQRFKLIGGHDLANPEYSQTLTGENDLIKGDEYMDLKFTKLIPGLKYWLEVDPGGNGAKHLAFESLPWADIKTG
jgi:hypothetical protein